MTPDEAHEHLAAIRRVIDRSRAERARSGDIYVVWGLVLLVADVVYLTLEGRGIFWSWLAWPIASVIGSVYAAVATRRRRQRVRTFGARIEGTLWMSMAAAMTILVFGGMATGTMNVALIGPLVSCLVAMAMLTSATVFDSPLMRASGVMFLGLAVCCLLVSWWTQYVLFGVALLFGYVLPGLWWMREERRARDG